MTISHKFITNAYLIPHLCCRTIILNLNTVMNLKDILGSVINQLGSSQFKSPSFLFAFSSINKYTYIIYKILRSWHLRTTSSATNVLKRNWILNYDRGQIESPYTVGVHAIFKCLKYASMRKISKKKKDVENISTSNLANYYCSW